MSSNEVVSAMVMKSAEPCILTLNGGSSSIKFAVFAAADVSRRIFDGKIDRVAMFGSTLICRNAEGNVRDSRDISVRDTSDVVVFLLDWLQQQPEFPAVQMAGHRIVHGMMHSVPELITPQLLAELHRIKPYDPDHLPLEICLIETLRERHPAMPQVACFDTAFHRTMPRVASLLPIPRCYDAAGVRRYGFHGLSYQFLMAELRRRADPAASNGRVILAHLGNGASLAAVRDGKSIDTTMGFTPASGIMMSSRSGDLDPGLFDYLARTENMNAQQFSRMVNSSSGLLGLSETSSDMRDLLEKELQDERAAEAIAVFCYQIRKTIGAYAAALGGLDTLVFSGGIGENAAVIRSRICQGLAFLGIAIDENQNAENASDISSIKSKVVVHVIPTDEECMIAAMAEDVVSQVK